MKRVLVRIPIKRARACPGQRQPRLVGPVHDLLSAEAAAQPAGAHGLIALDWLNGNRSVLVDHHLPGVVAGLTLATRAPDIYRALIEATAFGTRVIVDALRTLDGEERRFDSECPRKMHAGRIDRRVADRMKGNRDP